MSKGSKKKKGKTNKEDPKKPVPIKKTGQARKTKVKYPDNQNKAGTSSIDRLVSRLLKDLHPLIEKALQSGSHKINQAEEFPIRRRLFLKEQTEGIGLILDRKEAVVHIPLRMATFNFTVFNIAEYKKVLNKAEFLNNIQAFKYTGFDPLAVRTLIVSKPGFSIDDVITCTYLYLSRGTNLKKIINHVPDSGKTTINALIGKYNIISTIKGADSNAINLARFAACFPAAILTILTTLKAEDISRPVNLDALGKWTTEKFPPCFTCSGVAALVPKTPIRGLDDKGIQLIIELITFYSALETRVLDKTKKGATLTELYNTALVYVTAAHNSVITTEEESFLILHLGGHDQT
ncbi:hypothetical protein FQA39_LY05461 [Lamprigera yunnana]|nr:hypothetical protein FQA39_LY05461 [Lamprigera yunnana]